MRNLKRALSLALAAIMLLGMMIVGTSAVSIDDFTDSDAVQNVEAVTLTSGLGIFQGRTDGSFDPTAPVTRAEMAVIICKILHGADVSPDNFTGTQQFTDVPAWAEGYVNMCSALGIIAGRGNGIFDPDTTVTTVEAATMLLKALGYYVTANDALGADWDLEVTSRANALKLYGDLTLNMRAPLTRDNVAELVYNTLFAQMVAFNDYRGQYVKNTNRDVVVTAGTDDEANTLAYNTFKLYVAEGVVMANGYTEKALAQSSTNNSQTTVMFTEDTDLDKDGRKEFSEGDEFDFNAGTPLNLIGHAVKVYYTYTKKAPIVYAITDQAALTAVIDYNANTTKLAEAANDAGFKKNSILDVDLDDYKVNYDMDVTLEEVKSDSWSDGNPIYTTAYQLTGKKLLLISNSGNLDLSGEYDYVIVLDQFLTVVDEVEEIRGEVEYSLKANSALHSANGDVNIPLYSDVTEEDYVVATNIGLQDEVVVFYEATLVDATITRITGVSNSNADAKKITADGVVYTKSPVWDNSDTTEALADLLTKFVDVKDLEDETLVLDEFGLMIGIAEAQKVYKYAYIAQYGVVHTTGTLNTVNRLTAHVFFADGTEGVYQVDSCPTGIYPSPKDVEETAITTLTTNLNSGNGYGAVSAAVNANTGANAAPALGIWDVNVKNNGRIEIAYPHNQEDTSETDSVDPDYGKVSQTGAAEAGIRLIQNHSTFVTPGNVAVQGVDWSGRTAAHFSGSTEFNVSDHTFAGSTNGILYQNTGTVYFYVNNATNNNKYDGTGARQYDTDKLEVEVRIGIANAHTFKNNDDNRGEGIKEVLASTSGTRTVVNAVLVEGVELSTSDVYYYNEGNYHMTADGLVYELYDKDGNMVEKLYKDLKKSDAQSKPDGFYLAKSDNIVPYSLDDSSLNAGAWTGISGPATASGTDCLEGYRGDVYYVVNDVAQYDEYVQNFFGSLTPQGNISNNVKIVDVGGTGLDTVAKLTRAIRTDGNVRISYSYSTKDYVLKTVYVGDYDPDSTDAPGNRNGNRYFNDSIVPSVSGTTMSVSADIYARRSDTTAVSDASVTGVTNVVVKYTIKAYNWITGETSSYERVTRNAASITSPGAFSDSVTIPAFLSSFTNGEVTFTATWKGGDGKTYSAVGTFEY